MVNKLKIFHPACEMSIVQDIANYNLPDLIMQFEKNLDSLPAFFCNTDDFILVHEYLSENFIFYLEKLVGKKINFIRYAELKNLNSSDFIVDPWCFSPYIKERLNKFGFTHFNQNYTQEKLKEYFSKINAKNLLFNILKNNKPYFIPKENAGRIVSSYEEVIENIDEKIPIVIKAPISSSGRGNLMLRKSIISDYHKQWMNSFLSKQGLLIVEPLWNKKLDLAAEFELTEKGIDFLGYSIFSTNTNGFYLGNYLNFDIEELKISYPSIDFDGWIEILKAEILNCTYLQDYTGLLGVDAMVVQDKENNILLYPCMEVNPRFTMGMLALHLNEIISDEATGKMHIYYDKTKSFKEFATEMQQTNSQEWKREKAYSGFFPLVEPREGQYFGAYMLLNKN